MKRDELKNPSRRSFIRSTALATGGFVVGSALKIEPVSAGESNIAFGPFIRIEPDSTVTVLIKHLDKGQGITTGLTTIVAEELDAAWSQMRATFAPADAAKYANLFYGVQGTGGSTSCTRMPASRWRASSRRSLSRTWTRPGR